MATAKTTPKSKDLIGCKTKSNHRARCTIAMHFSVILWRSLVNDNVQFPNLKSTCSLLCQKYRRREKEIIEKLSPLRKGFMIFFLFFFFNCCCRRRGCLSSILPSCWLLPFKLKKNLPKFDESVIVSEIMCSSCIEGKENCNKMCWFHLEL